MTNAAFNITLYQEQLETLLPHPYTRLEASILYTKLQGYQTDIRNLEKIIRKDLHLEKKYEMLRTTPGIGLALASTIALEVGSIDRFKGAGNYASYCRCVQSKWSSNGKNKNKKKEKNGNKYLGWAYVEAANYAARHNETIGKHIQKKTAKKNRCVAIKATAAKLAKANFYMMRDQEPFDIKRVFGS